MPRRWKKREEAARENQNESVSQAFSSGGCLVQPIPQLVGPVRLQTFQQGIELIPETGGAGAKVVGVIDEDVAP